jgi:pyruvate dehydrogenase E2 component (dihydrolipoamide acetyltransferase)
MDVAMRMPDMATTTSLVRVVRWLVVVGESVRRGQPIVEVETDKAVMEVESIVTGTLRSLAIPPGGEATPGQVIAVFEADGAAAFQGPASDGGAAVEPSATSVDQGFPAPVAGARAASPRVSFFARNREARAARRAAPSLPKVVRLSVAQRTLVRRMRESKQNVPHFYIQTSANAEPMKARRAASRGRKVAWDALFVHAVGKALARFERMCYRFENDELVAQKADAIGVAVDLDGELFAVAVEHPASRMPEQISEEIRAAIERLKSGDPWARLSRPTDLTVSNLGMANVESFAAIIKPPESSALAIGKVRPVVVAVDGLVAVQNRVTLTLSVDHRVVNGRYAAAFLGAILEELESL